jgi:acyl carrier protein
VDNQIKLRGIRIELGEIEAVLGRHPAIAEAAVAVHGDSAGDKRLAAYIVPRKGLPPPAVADLRAMLKGELPVQMVPAVFITLDSLPVSASGKVDRAALPTADVGRRGVDGDYTAPRSPVELDLVDLWADLLKADLVGVDDNFFDLGGDSLKAGLFLSRVEESFGVKVPLRQFFAQATVAELGAIIDEQRTAAAGIERG